MKYLKYRTIHVILLLFLFQAVMGQEPPPRPLRITVTQNLSFGAFYQGAGGGTVRVRTDLSRNATGDVVLLTMGYSFSPAIYSITGTPGRIVSFLNPGEITLTGSNGGSLKLNLGSSNPASPFVLSSTPLSLYIEGILTVGPPASNPPGNFSGSFNITLMQE